MADLEINKKTIWFITAIICFFLTLTIHKLFSIGIIISLILGIITIYNEPEKKEKK